MLNDPTVMVISDPSMQMLEQTLDESPTQTIPAENSELLQAFAAFLAKEHIQPVPVDDQVDLFSLFREIAELKNEVKLESRQIKKTLDDYKELIGLLKTNNELLSCQLIQQNEVQLQSKEQQRKEFALKLIEFCDYLELSLENMLCLRKSGWRSTWSSSGKFISRVVEGQTLLLSRFTALLNTLDVKPISVMDKVFDPSIMCVAEICFIAERANGVVISEVQKGYFIGHAVLRLADVVVNKTK